MKATRLIDSSRLEIPEAGHGSPVIQDGCARPKAAAHAGGGLSKSFGLVLSIFVTLSMFMALVLLQQQPQAVDGFSFGKFLKNKSDEQNQILWEKDLASAKWRAKNDHKLLLIHFSGDQCMPCRKMEKEVFPAPNVVDVVNAEYVAVKIDTNKNQDLVAKYEVKGIPTDMYFTPNGEKIYQRTGGTNAEQYVNELKKVAGDYSIAQQKQMRKSQVAAQKQPAGQQAVTTKMENTADGYAVSKMPANPRISEAGSSQYNRLASYRENTSSPAEQPSLIANSPASPVTNSPAQVDPPPQHSVVPSVILQAATSQPVPAPQPTPVSQSTTASRSTTEATPVIPETGLIAKNQTPPIGVFENIVVNKPLQTGLGAGTSLGLATIAKNHVNTEKTAVNASMLLPQNDTPVRQSDELPNMNPPKNPNEKIMAMDGYCPVTLVEISKWAKGDPNITFVHEGITFQFISAEARQKFLANPERYAPALGGRDIVEWTLSHQNVAGSRKFGAWFQNRIYLFANEDNYQKFQANPNFYAVHIP